METVESMCCRKGQAPNLLVHQCNQATSVGDSAEYLAENSEEDSPGLMRAPLGVMDSPSDVSLAQYQRSQWSQRS